LAALLSAGLGHAAEIAFPDDEKAIVHVLNRITFGPRPSDVDRVRRIGLRQYIHQQLHPERIPDAGMDAKLAHLETVGLSSREISRRFEQPLVDARRSRQQQAASPNDSSMPSQPPRPSIRQRANDVIAELAEQKLLRAIYSDRQLQEVLADFWFNHFNVDARKGRGRFLLTEYERDAIRPHVLGRFRDLLAATAHSPAMLFYLDNWLSADPNGPHPAGREPAVFLPRSRVLPGSRGSGRAAMPAPRPTPPGTAGAAPRNGRRTGLNENYARELMELHTLGVDGGYTQADVTEVARALTGWTIDNPRQGGGFRFEPRVHDAGEKRILGHLIEPGGGKRDGDRVLDILAAHPSTARFVTTKLARRFVSDTPPPALVDRLAARFSATAGDLRAVMGGLLTSPEFLAPESYRAKVKSPVEFVVSAIRATGSELAGARPLVLALQDLGQPLYQCQPPTGYKDTADAWTNTGALLARMNFALALASGGPLAAGPRANAVPRDAARQPRGGLGVLMPPVATWPDRVEAALAHDLSDATHAAIARASSPPERAALALGSPEFQRR
jgi:uncharacterized protein (DUF1800 family)